MPQLITHAPVDFVSDLTKGDRDYLKRKEINQQKFDGLTAKAQQQWKEECKKGYYEKNDYELGVVDSSGKFRGKTSSFTVPDLPWKQAK